MKKVLIVDNSATIRDHVSLVLKQAGFAVVEASDGAEGASLLDTDDDIGLVIVDVNMPGMNGIEMLEKVKRDPRHAALPMVVLTTEGQLSLIRRAKSAGARAWIVKPFDTTQMIAVAQKLMAS